MNSKQESSGPADIVEPESMEDERNSDSEVLRSSGSMAIATLISRVTGFLRTILLAASLGAAVSSAFNTANTLPNMITELVLGAVLTSLVIPVLVRAEKEDSDRGAGFIRRLLTLTFTLMLTVTVIAVLAAPFLTSVMLRSNGQVNVEMSTAFAYLLLPQILFYSLFAVLMAVLNTKRVFKPGAWAPVANNVITIIVLLVYMRLPNLLQPDEVVSVTDPRILLLGLGTTAGVVVQAAIMFPYLRRAEIDIRPLWGLDQRLKQFGGMAIAIIVYVAISQAGYIVTNNIASAADSSAITVYFQMWQLLQLPYGVIGVTLLTAIMPRLSRHAAANNIPAVIKDLASATRMTFLALIPVVIFFFFFATPLVVSFFALGNYSFETAEILGMTVSYSAFTLIPYALVLLHLRVFYAREEVWTPTYIVAGITITKIILSLLALQIASDPAHVVVWLGVVNGLAYCVGAGIGHVLLKRSLKDMQTKRTIFESTLIFGASLVAGILAYFLDHLLVAPIFTGESNLTYLARTVVDGIVFLTLTCSFLFLLRNRVTEVALVGSLFGRLPVIGRFIHSSDLAETMEEEALSGATLPSAPVGQERFIPGAWVADGKFRLISGQGGRSGIQFWKGQRPSDEPEAEELDDVAISIIDTLDFPDDVSKQQILVQCLTMFDVQSPGFAPVVEIIEDDSYIFILSVWTEGMSLRQAVAGQVDAGEVGTAIAALADGVATCHEQGLPAGLDCSDRVRIDAATGNAVLAFPGIIPKDSTSQDIHGLGVTLELAMRTADSVPVSYEQLILSALRVKGITAAEWAEQLQRASYAQS